MMDGHVQNTVEKQSPEFLVLKSFTEDTRKNISPLIYSCRLPCHGSICFRKKKSGYFPSKMLQCAPKSLTRDPQRLGLTLLQTNHHNMIGNCLLATRLQRTHSHHLPLKWFMAMKSLTYCHWNDHHETACQWTPQWSGTQFIIPDISAHWFFSIRLRGNVV